jgi:tRNA (guanine-N7-)-methyltransferase
MAKTLAEIDARGVRNVRLHHGDATVVIDWLPAGSIGGIDLLYPDPWPKRRHWKRRFVQDQRLRELARLLRPGALFRFASDSADYVAWTLIRLLRSPDFMWTAERADDWRRPWPGFDSTRYEAKAMREGRAPCYLVFERR